MSKPLYERTKEIMGLWEQIDEIEEKNRSGDGLTDEDNLALANLYAALGEAEGGFEKKVEACAAAIREMQAMAGVAADEADRLNERAKAFANRASRLKEYVKREMESAECPKVMTELFTVSVRRNAPSTNVTDPEAIPEKFIHVEEVKKVDKREIAAAIKAGEQVPGAELVYSTSIVIK